MKKYLKMAAITLTAALALCGCGAANQERQDSPEQEESATAEAVSAVSEDESSAGSGTDSDEMANVYNISYREPDKEGICEYFLEGYDVSQMPEANPQNGLVDIAYEDTRLSFTTTGISYMADDLSDALGGIAWDWFDRARMEAGEGSPDSDDNIEAVKKDLTKLLLREGEELVAETVIVKEAAQLPGVMKEYDVYDDTFTPDAEKYYFLQFGVEKDGIPIMNFAEADQTYQVEIWGAQRTGIDVVCADSKVLFLSVSGLYEYGEAESGKLISQEEARKIAEEKNSLLLTDTAKKDLSTAAVWLEYVGLPDYTRSDFALDKLAPYWCISWPDEDGYPQAIRINAITGGDLAYGE